MTAAKHTAHLLTVLVASMVGCRTVPEVTHPSPIADSEYDRVFEAAVRALRDMRFVIDRQDRRLGVITTEPRVAASLLEPWQPDATRSDQMVASTANLRRRIVRVTIEATEASEEAATPATPYRLRVTARLEQRETAGRQLTTAAFAAVAFRGRTAGTRSFDEDDGPAGWRDVGRDEAFEKHLLVAILRKSVGREPRHRSAPLDAVTGGDSVSDP